MTDVVIQSTSMIAGETGEKLYLWGNVFFSASQDKAIETKNARLDFYWYERFCTIFDILPQQIKICIENIALSRTF